MFSLTMQFFPNKHHKNLSIERSCQKEEIHKALCERSIRLLFFRAESFIFILRNTLFLISV